MQRDARNARGPLAKSAVELCDPCGDAVASNRAMQLDRSRYGEQVLVCHKSARRYEGRLRRRQLLTVLPRTERRVDSVGIEARNRGLELWPGIALSPQKPGASRREQPLVRAAGE